MASTYPVVLMVEDEAPVRAAWKRALRRAPARVHFAASAEEALQLTAAEPPDLLICDQNLGGGVSGMELVSRIRARHPAVQALLHTGEQELSATLGVPVLYKPCPTSVVLEIIRSLPQMQGAEAAVQG